LKREKAVLDDAEAAFLMLALFLSGFVLLQNSKQVNNETGNKEEKKSQNRGRWVGGRTTTTKTMWELLDI